MLGSPALLWSAAAVTDLRLSRMSSASRRNLVRQGLRSGFGGKGARIRRSRRGCCGAAVMMVAKVGDDCSGRRRSIIFASFGSTPRMCTSSKARRTGVAAIFVEAQRFKTASSLSRVRNDLLTPPT